MGSKLSSIPGGEDDRPTLFIMPADGGEPRRLFKDAWPYFQPSWSPDGGRVAFVSFKGGTADVWVAPIADPEKLERVTMDEATEQFPVWSPDGKGVLYSTNRGGDYDLWYADLLTGKQSRVTDLSGDEIQASFSPDGSLIVYGYKNGDSQEIWIMRASGGQAVQITSESHGGWPSWSPDADKLVFTSNRSGNLDLWIVDVRQQVEALLQPEK
jgi:Tol biopolymer transport system component